jgi:hypothetical protein
VSTSTGIRRKGRLTAIFVPFLSLSGFDEFWVEEDGDCGRIISDLSSS